MREILFRGKRKSTGEWLYGQLLQITLRSGRRGRFIHENPIGGYDSTTEIEDDTVGQYTGITDKNGAMVFEGDIVKVENDNGRTDFSDGGIGDVSFYGGLWYVSGEVNNALYDLSKCYYLSVIGNIYDNPELLEGE